MKKFLLRVLGFVPVAAAGYALLLFVLGDLGCGSTMVTGMGHPDHLSLRVKDIRNYHDVDILFLGSSHSYRTFDTRFYNRQGYSCFNLGSSNQTPMQTYVLLNQYLDSINPKQVIFEVHTDIMANDGVEAAVNLLRNVPISGAGFRMALEERNMKVFNTCLYAFYSQKIRHRLEHYAEDTVTNNYRYIPGGFCEVDSNEFEVKRYPMTDLKIEPRQMRALKRCLRLLEVRGIPYTLVEVQDAEQLRRSFRNHDWFEQQMSALGPYRYKILPLVDTLHFYNSNHLDKAGIELFNEDLAADLRKDNSLMP